MLRRVLSLAQGGSASSPARGAWSIDQALDGQGRLTSPPPGARPISSEAWDGARPSPSSPAGLYRLGAASAALNVIAADTAVEALPRNLPGAVFTGLDGPRPVRLAGGLLTAALIMLIADVVIALALAGRIPALNPRAGASVSARLPLPSSCSPQDHRRRTLNRSSPTASWRPTSSRWTPRWSCASATY